MCGRLACTLAADDVSSSCCFLDKDGKWKKPSWIPSSYDYKPFYNGPPSTVVAVLAHKNHFPERNDEACSNICIAAMRWGMLPTYRTESTGNFHTHNARLENVTKSVIYKPCLSTGKRCIVVADGYYEWQTTQGENNKQPYFVYQENNPEANVTEDTKGQKYLIKLAGLFNVVKDENGDKYTCTILTKESDNTMSWMHHRMPIVLNTQEDMKQWLNYEEFPYVDALSNFAQDSGKYALNHYTVNKRYVNKSSFNSEKCMERLTVKRKNTLDGWLKSK